MNSNLTGMAVNIYDVQKTKRLMATYYIPEDKSSITCLLCGAHSHNRKDVEMKYCASCHQFLEDEPPVCDFCMVPAPHVTAIRAVGHLEGMFSPTVGFVDADGLWGACADCNVLIQAEDWKGLVDRCLSHHLKRAENKHMKTDSPEIFRQKVIFIYTAVFGPKFEA